MLGALKPRAPSGYTSFVSSIAGRPIPGDGLAILIRNGIPSKLCQINSNIPALAVQVQLDRIYTICNVYMPHHTDITQNHIEQLMQQLPPPIIFAGDFNAKHALWGNTISDRRGHIVESFLGQSPLALLNTGQHTHFHVQTATSTAIDLTLCSAGMSADLSWGVDADLHGSDHWPIIINEIHATQTYRDPRYNFHKADWGGFYEETRVDPCDEILRVPSVDDLVASFSEVLIRAAELTIPKSSELVQPGRVPWWNPECDTANFERKKALRRYQRTQNVVDLISYKRARARAKYIKKKASRESWRKYVSSLNANTPMSKIWSRVRKMRGVYQPMTCPMLKHGGQDTGDPAEVAEILACHYESVSSSQNYAERFQRIRQRAESRDLNFDCRESLPYNEEFTLLELTHALRNCRDTSPGNDKISYKMISKAHPSCMQFLLAIYNRIWTNNTFPEEWRMGVILSFLKPGKASEDVKSYRPISLTSCVSKLMEKMVNCRLVRVLESGGLLPQQQNGFRKMRSTTDSLVSFTSDILSAFEAKESVLCVSFDIQKAYDTTWRFHIMRKLYEFGLRGNLPKYIENFLERRIFRTKMNKNLSNVHIQEQGVPQGSVISCLLFSLAINDVLKGLPCMVRGSLYVDDLLMYTTGNYLTGMERRLQVAINGVNRWANNHGFIFSPCKTVSIHFHRKRKLQPPPQLYIDGNPIPSKSTIKYLGMLLDEKLLWKEHIKQLKVDCMKRLDLLKMMSHTSWGADRLIMLRLYRSIIRSKLDYGCFVYSSAKPNVLQTLDPVHNAALRLCTGAFRSSPVISIYADAGEPSLSFRRRQLLLQYYVRTQQSPSAPTLKYIQQEEPPPTSIGAQISEALHETSLYSLKVLPFKYSVRPVWRLDPEVACRGFECPTKKNSTPLLLKALFTEHVSDNHAGAYSIYTDGAKDDGSVGSAAIADAVVVARKLPSCASIFTAELCGIIDALVVCRDSSSTNFVIYTDSKSVQRVITHFDSTHPLVSKIVQHLVNLASHHKSVVICWCPSHVDIEGNEKADREASAAAHSDVAVDQQIVPFRDYYPLIKSAVKNTWSQQWQQVQGNKLRMIKDCTRAWSSSNCEKRNYSRIITRLRIGHALFSHQHLMEGRPPPDCPHCGENLQLTVFHVLAECPFLSHARLRYFPSTRNMNVADITGEILSEKPNTVFQIQPVIDFLIEVDLYNYV